MITSRISSFNHSRGTQFNKLITLLTPPWFTRLAYYNMNQRDAAYMPHRRYVPMRMYTWWSCSRVTVETTFK
jgi:hypothetical protein